MRHLKLGYSFVADAEVYSRSMGGTAILGDSEN
jgi:hypothetical protein